MEDHQHIIDEYFAFLNHEHFPCIGAKTAVTKGQIRCKVADHMACPKDDQSILQFLYEFVDEYRQSDELFHSAAVIFKEPLIRSEDEYEELIWKRLQAFADLDAKNHTYDKRVDSDPASPHFSFSLKEEAFFIVGLNPSGSRLARQFKYPALVFNPHAQFERLRETNLFEHMKKVIRKRDTDYSGSFNPMLEDFGKSSEVYQYSGRQYDERWQCPFKPNHGSDEYNTTT